MTSVFDRALSADFINKLREEAKKGGWWADVLADKDLVLAPRGRYLSVYWQGQAIFTVRQRGAGVVATTHEKYLLKTELKDQVELVDGKSFAIAKLQESGFIRDYAKDTTLKNLKAVAGRFSGDEKKGCHRATLKNPKLMDVEIALIRDAQPVGDDPEEEAKRDSDRIDIVALEQSGSQARLVFWEAKNFTNTELRSANEVVVPVVSQIERYVSHVTARRAEIEECYRAVAKNIVDLKAMGARRAVDPLIETVAQDPERLTLGETPKVGLIIFGFRQSDKMDDGWKKHRTKLEDLLGKDAIKAAGKADNIPW